MSRLVAQLGTRREEGRLGGRAGASFRRGCSFGVNLRVRRPEGVLLRSDRFRSNGHSRRRLGNRQRVRRRAACRLGCRLRRWLGRRFGRRFGRLRTGVYGVRHFGGRFRSRLRGRLWCWFGSGFGRRLWCRLGSGFERRLLHRVGYRFGCRLWHGSGRRLLYGRGHRIGSRLGCRLRCWLGCWRGCRLRRRVWRWLRSRVWCRLWRRLGGWRGGWLGRRLWRRLWRKCRLGRWLGRRFGYRLWRWRRRRLGCRLRRRFGRSISRRCCGRFVSGRRFGGGFRSRTKLRACGILFGGAPGRLGALAWRRLALLLRSGLSSHDDKGADGNEERADKYQRQAPYRSGVFRADRYGAWW
jgi:hypothetical protein